MTTTDSHAGILGNNRALRRVLELVDVIAETDATVLIMGETGTGKELIARAIHRRSRRAGQPLVTVNCGAVPRELFESEFFGHARGSFTGAIRDRPGRFQLVIDLRDRDHIAMPSQHRRRPVNGSSHLKNL